MSSISTLAIVVTHSYPSTAPPSLSFPPHFNQRPSHYYFRSRILFSLSTQQPQPQPQGKSPTPTATKASTRKPVATYLMERLGFSEEDSLSISKKLLRQRDRSYIKQVTDLIYFEKADNVITFLQEHCGLNHSHINKVITKCPRVLTADLEKTIKPKIKLLQDLGFSTSDLALALSTSPRILLECDLTPAIQALRGIVGSDEIVVKLFKGLKYGTADKIITNLIPNVTMLENEYGIPRDKLIKVLTKTPQSLLWKTEWLREVLVKLEGKWGITRDSTKFLRAVHVFSGLTDEKIFSKCQVFWSYGFSDSDILSLIRRHPASLALSEANINKKLEFFMNELRYNPAYLASRPALFDLSLENRVVPRHIVLSILKEKGRIKPDYQLYSSISLTDHQFFDRFIRPFQNEVPKLRQVYINGGAPTEELQHLETSRKKT